MAAPQHDEDHDDLAAGVQAAAEAVALVGQADADADGGVARHDLEQDREDAVRRRVRERVPRLDQRDQEQR